MKNSKLLPAFIILLIVYLIYKNIASSVFLKNKDRVNVVFYSASSVYYSIGFNDVGYIIPVPVNMNVIVPGGYGYYRVGALGKLVSLENKPEIFRKTFSAITYSIVDIYFYPAEPAVYYHISKSNTLPSFSDVFLSKSNANMIDRILIYWQFMQPAIKQYQTIDQLPTITDNGKTVFDQDTFYKHYQGFFYRKTYRDLMDNVQILYTSNYDSAYLLSQIIEGEGIRVVDLSQADNLGKSCQMVATKDKINDLTVVNLAKDLGCPREIGKPAESDIIIKLGNLENDWAIN